MKYYWKENEINNFINYELIPINKEHINYVCIVKNKNNEFSLKANIAKIKNKKLSATNLDEAKAEAHSLIYESLNKKINELQKMIQIFNDFNNFSWKDEKIASYIYNKNEPEKTIVTMKSVLLYKNNKLPYLITLYEENEKQYFYEFAFGGIKLRKINENDIVNAKQFIIVFCKERLNHLYNTTNDFYELFIDF